MMGLRVLYVPFAAILITFGWAVILPIAPYPEVIQEGGPGVQFLDAQVLAGMFYYKRYQGDLFLDFLKQENYDSFALQGPVSDFRDAATLLVRDFAQKLTAAQQRGVQQPHSEVRYAAERDLVGILAGKRHGDGASAKEWSPLQDAERKEWGRLIQLGPGDRAGSSHAIGTPSSSTPSSE
ncbi:conserved hypothetical Ustilaginaceae-specific protein [Sporisorium reilianum SRZ2]|uniref:Conserved hypothetical Ustilaginaceae-specific protein n=1 Tax=Sporisorium reilianum (strain SRZ2) TaxID=999809 RepID=E7A099_SPORE|nr:conserved hypothetical Ustilaginaceae-specific protein [Sporisorium reilianum SRZ2]